MFYKHKYFTLNEESREIFDEFNRPVKITGNSYLLLLFLCKDVKFAKSTEINEFIDPVAEINDDHIRQYRYKIKLALNHDIVRFKSQRYSIDGDVVKVSKLSEELTKENNLTEAERSGEVIVTNKLNVSKFFNKSNKIKFLATILSIALIILIVFITYKINESTIVKPENEMVLIPAGEFIMGSTEEQAMNAYGACEEGNQCSKEDYLVEYPQRKVFAKDFYIDKKEVSNADYNLFIKATSHKLALSANDSNFNANNQPVFGVTWNDANDYCLWLNKRLPTETEWEKAARGTDGRIWSWGNVWDTKKTNHGQGGVPGYDESDGYKYTAPVGALLNVSPYGVLNMSGNVSEWASDNFLAYPGNDKFLHLKFSNLYKVIRGGDYIYGKSDTRTAVRWYAPADSQEEDTGFRCAKDK